MYNTKMVRLANKYVDYRNYTLKLLRRIDSSGTITTEAREMFDRYICSVQKRLVGCIISRADSNKVKTVHVEDVSAVLRFIIPSELNRMCRVHITRSFDNIHEFSSSEIQPCPGVRKKRTTTTERSKLMFTPSRIVTFTKRIRPDIRVTPNGCVALAATLQCVAEIVLMESLRIKNTCNKQRVTHEHVYKAVSEEPGLRELFIC